MKLTTISAALLTALFSTAAFAQFDMGYNPALASSIGYIDIAQPSAIAIPVPPPALPTPAQEMWVRDVMVSAPPSHGGWEYTEAMAHINAVNSGDIGHVMKPYKTSEAGLSSGFLFMYADGGGGGGSAVASDPYDDGLGPNSQALAVYPAAVAPSTTWSYEAPLSQPQFDTPVIAPPSQGPSQETMNALTQPASYPVFAEELKTAGQLGVSDVYLRLFESSYKAVTAQNADSLIVRGLIAQTLQEANQKIQDLALQAAEGISDPSAMRNQIFEIQKDAVRTLNSDVDKYFYGVQPGPPPAVRVVDLGSPPSYMDMEHMAGFDPGTSPLEQRISNLSPQSFRAADVQMLSSQVAGVIHSAYDNVQRIYQEVTAVKPEAFELQSAVRAIVQNGDSLDMVRQNVRLQTAESVRGLIIQSMARDL